MACPERGCLPHRGWQRLPATRVCLEDGNRLELADPGGCGPAEVRGFRIEAPVDAAADLRITRPASNERRPSWAPIELSAAPTAGPDRTVTTHRPRRRRVRAPTPSAAKSLTSWHAPASSAQPISRYGSPSGRTRRPAPRNAPRRRLRRQQERSDVATTGSTPTRKYCTRLAAATRDTCAGIPSA